MTSGTGPRRRTDVDELRIKIVFAGPGLSGKTTNLMQLHDRAPEDRRGRLVSLSSGDERTLFFDFLPLDLGAVGRRRVRLALYSVPGQNRFRVNQALILRDAGGIVFVADSHPFRRDANVRSLELLKAHLAETGRVLSARAELPDEVPVVMQYNKRDLPTRMPLDELESALNPGRAPFVPAIAVRGRGVADTLKEITRRALARCLREAAGAGRSVDG